jgi:replicative DNA helicase
MTRPPPKDLEAEKSVIGSILRGSSCLDEIAPILKPDDFFGEHGKIYRAALKLYRESNPVDLVTVGNELKFYGTPEENFWTRMLLDAYENTPHEGHAKYHAEIVVSKACDRRLLYVLTDAAKDIYSESMDRLAVIRCIEAEIDAQSEQRTNGKGISVNDVLMEVIADLEKDTPPGIRSGVREFDSITDGMKPEDMIVLAARPGVGKSSLMLGMATYVSRTSGPVLIVSQEMSRVQLVKRMLAASCGTTTKSLKGMLNNETSRPTFMAAAESLQKLPILFDDQPNRHMAEIEALARIHKRNGGLSLICLDYLQLIKPDDSRAPAESQIAQISRDCKMLAKSLSLPVLVLAQLNRAVESRDNRRPKLSDLRSSGAIEQDADVVMFLDRKSMWDKSANPEHAMLIVEKNRHGEPRDISLIWNGPTMKFSNPERPTWSSADTYEPSGDDNE